MALALGGQTKPLPQLLDLADHDDDPMVADYARWAADQLAPQSRPGRDWHVLAGTVSGDGSSTSPFATIAAAIAVAGPGDTVLIHDGVYRECIHPWRGGSGPDQRLVIAAAPGASPEITAADSWATEWRDEGDGLWSAPYDRLAWDDPSTWEAPATNTPPHRCEQVWCDGALLTHVEKTEQLQTTLASFRTDDESGRIWVHVVNGAAVHSWERSARMQCLVPRVRGLGWITVRGLRLRGGAAPIWTGANWHTWDQESVLSVAAGHHWLIDNNDIGWGNAQGLALGHGGFSVRSKATPILAPVNAPAGQERGGWHIVRGNRVHHHGIAGIVGLGGMYGVLIEDNDCDFNVVKDVQGTCEEAGIKLHSNEDCVLRRNRVRWNRGFGIWIDYHCQRNRISQNILIDNDANHLFHEISAGPVLVDGNVVIETRGKAVGAGSHGGACGFYTHDGSGATVINNCFIGTVTGARVRALFHRKDGDDYTRTNDNVIANNLFIDCQQESVWLMPEKARAERNRSAANLYWRQGRTPLNRLENGGDVGLDWAELPYGQATGHTLGDATVDLATWARYMGHDADSLLIPPSILDLGRDPEAIRARLRRAWADRGLPDAGLLLHAEPMSAAEYLHLLCPSLRGAPLRTEHLSPTGGVQVWQDDASSCQLTWSGDDCRGLVVNEMPPLCQAPVATPIPVIGAIGDQITVEVPAGTRILVSGLPARIADGRLLIAVPSTASPGSYAVLLLRPAGWHRQAIEIRPMVTISAVEALPLAGACRVLLANNGSQSTSATVTVSFGDRGWTASAALPAGTDTAIDVPVAVDDAGEFSITVDLPNDAITTTRLLSFARATRGLVPWESCTRYDLDRFPGGLYPDGAWAFVFYMGRLHAGWRARWHARGIDVRVEVRSTLHHCVRDDVNGVHTGSGVKIEVKGPAGGKSSQIGLNLRSDTGAQQAGFCKTANESVWDIGMHSGRVPFSVCRSGVETIYELTITWDMLGLAAAPAAGSRLPFSLMVSQNDEGYTYGLQWFFGISYSHHEGDEAWMGRLWLA